MPSAHPLKVVIAGGGPAAVEAMLALHDLAGDRVRVTLVAPDHDLELKPFRAATPFAADVAHTYPIADLVHDARAELVRDTLAEVRPDDHVVVLGSGEELGYDRLVVAVGARPRAPFARALTFGTGPRADDLNDVLSDLEGGYSRSVAFVVPSGISWPLPVYELALLTAREVFSMGIDGLHVTVVSPEEAPLALFGPAASHAVAELLSQAGITFRGGVHASVEDADLRLRPGDEVLTGHRVVTVPVLEGPRDRGAAGGRRRLPGDRRARPSPGRGGRLRRGGRRRLPRQAGRPGLPAGRCGGARHRGRRRGRGRGRAVPPRPAGQAAHGPRGGVPADAAGRRRR